MTERRVYIYGTGIIAHNLALTFRDEISLLGYIETVPSNTEMGG